MGKRLKLRLSRVFSSLNSSCRSKDPSNLPRSPLPVPVPVPVPTTTPTTTNTAFFMLSPNNPKALDIDFPNSRHVSSSSSTLNRWIQRGHPDPDPHPHPTGSQNQQFRWRREEKWHVVAKVNQPSDTPSSPRRKLCNSSASSSSSEYDSETQLLRQSAESHYPRPLLSRKNKKKRIKSRKSCYGSRGGDETESVVSKRGWAGSSGCAKVEESLAVVKRSEDPYEDFKRSMLEMILAKEMFDVGELKQLLHCFLALNSPHHHGVIVEAFSDVWEILFCE